MANNFTITLKNYTSYCKQGSFNRRFHGGVVTYIHNSLVQEEIVLQTDLEAVTNKITLPNGKPVNLINIYIPGSKSLCKEDLDTILDQVTTPTMIMGDLNAHHTRWGNSNCDSRGNLIDNICTEKNLNILNDGQATHESGNVIDLTIAKPSICPDIT